jgi:hypothetical protein
MHFRLRSFCSEKLLTGFCLKIILLILTGLQPGVNCGLHLGTVLTVSGFESEQTVETIEESSDGTSTRLKPDENEMKDFWGEATLRSNESGPRELEETELLSLASRGSCDRPNRDSPQWENRKSGASPLVET